MRARISKVLYEHDVKFAGVVFLILLPGAVAMKLLGVFEMLQGLL